MLREFAGSDFSALSVAQLASTLAPRTGEHVGVCEASRDAMVFAEVAKMWGRHFKLILNICEKKFPHRTLLAGT